MHCSVSESKFTLLFVVKTITTKKITYAMHPKKASVHLLIMLAFETKDAGNTRIQMSIAVSAMDSGPIFGKKLIGELNIASSQSKPVSKRIDKPDAIKLLANILRFIRRRMASRNQDIDPDSRFQ